ncbi:MAG: NTP transferase domain-containing protein [Acetivibrio ethanolgignens]
MKTGAIILAAGHKSSISAFQPMLPVGNTTVIKRIILTLKQSGTEPIVVITGREAKELEKHISKQQVICLQNKDYENTQMFDSICMGLKYIEDLCDRVLFLPAKFPKLLPETIKRIMASEKKVACPVYNGRRGHPVLIDRELIPVIISYSGERGLRGALRQPQIEAFVEEVPITDKGIIEAVESDEDTASYSPLEQLALHPSVKLYLERDEVFFGPGIAQFLKLIDHTGSMQSACWQMNMSYSKGWKIMKTAEKQLGYPLLLTQSGGAEGGFSELTPKARDFLERFVKMEQEVKEKTEELFYKYFENKY